MSLFTNVAISKCVELCINLLFNVSNSVIQNGGKVYRAQFQKEATIASNIPCDIDVFLICSLTNKSKSSGDIINEATLSSASFTSFDKRGGDSDSLSVLDSTGSLKIDRMSPKRLQTAKKFR